MRKHTRRRRGAQVLDEGFIEWEQTGRIYELFSCDLNIFERIFFTVDVGDSLSVLSKICTAVLIIAILLSITNWMVSTMPIFREVDEMCTSTAVGNCPPIPKTPLRIMEHICVYVFTAEYLTRLLTVHSVRFEILDKHFLESVLTGEDRQGGDEGLFEDRHDCRGKAHAHGAACCADEDARPVGSCPSDNLVAGPHGGWVSEAPGESPPHSAGMGALEESLPGAKEEPSHPDSTFLVRQRHPAEKPPRLDGWLKTTSKHVIGPSNLVDLVSILPFWLERLMSSGGNKGGIFAVLRVLRLTRIFRVFKVGQYNEMFGLFVVVMRQSLPALCLMVFFIGMGLCLFGTLVWFVEQGVWYPDGDKALVDRGIIGRGAYLRVVDGQVCEAGNLGCLAESPFISIVHTFWYVIATITTVGYGEVAPTSWLGKFVGGTTIITGVVVLAMPIGVISANFGYEFERSVLERKRRERLQLQLAQKARSELEEDAEVEAEMRATGLARSGVDRGIEAQRIEEARFRILTEAEAIDSEWRLQLPEELHHQLSRALRGVVMSFLGLNFAETSPDTQPELSMKVFLRDLDNLAVVVRSAITGVTTFGVVDSSAESEIPSRRLVDVRKALELRRAWAQFMESCWAYGVDLCKIQQEPNFCGEYFVMKAKLNCLTEGAGPAGSMTMPKRSSRG